MVLGVWAQRRFRVDDPAVDAIRRSGRAQVREPRPLLDSAEQQGRAVFEERGTRVEYRVGGVRPIGRGKDGILFVSRKERSKSHFPRHGADSKAFDPAIPTRAAARISSRAIKKDRVDSAP